MRQIRLIGVEMGVGSPKPGTSKGPSCLKDTSLAQTIGASWQSMIRSDDPDDLAGTLEALPLVAETCKRLSKETSQAIAQDSFPCVIGGDHAIAIGTWSGITSQMQAQQKFGLIWIDAHMDSHTDQTTPSNAIHGMPLAALMGYGIETLTEIASPIPKLSPQHVVLIGVRSFEEGEKNLLNDLKVRVIDRIEVHKRGFQACFEEALTIVQRGTQGFGVSVDLDAFDPRFAPGVGVPEADGLDPENVLPAMQGLINNPNFKGFEVVELNPPLDIEERTLKLAQKLIKDTLSE